MPDFEVLEEERFNQNNEFEIPHLEVFVSVM